MKIVFVVAYDLARKCGFFIVGPETQIACDKAAEICNAIAMVDMCSRSQTDLIVVATAGYVKTADGDIYMAHVMRNYLRTIIRENFPIVIRRADTFNTSGEMEALVELIINLNQRRTQVTDITLAVKWWHAPRSWFLCKYWLWKNHLTIPVYVSYCHSQVGWHIIAKEFFLAIPQNILRLIAIGR